MQFTYAPRDKGLAIQPFAVHSGGALLMRHVETMALVILRRFKSVTARRDAGLAGRAGNLVPGERSEGSLSFEEKWSPETGTPGVADRATETGEGVRIARSHASGKAKRDSSADSENWTPRQWRARAGGFFFLSPPMR